MEIQYIKGGDKMKRVAISLYRHPFFNKITKMPLNLFLIIKSSVTITKLNLLIIITLK